MFSGTVFYSFTVMKVVSLSPHADIKSGRQTITVTGCYNAPSDCSFVLKAAFDGSRVSGLTYQTPTLITKTCYHQMIPVPTPTLTTCGECYKNIFKIGNGYYDIGDTCTELAGKKRLYKLCAKGELCMVMQLVINHDVGFIYSNSIGCSNPKRSQENVCWDGMSQFDQSLKDRVIRCTVKDVSRLTSWIG